MRTLLAAVVIAVAGGCAAPAPPRVDDDTGTTAPSLPENRVGVRIDGVDGTVMTGELLNGSITIDSGQGPLTLQSSHIHTITFGSDGDRIDADNINVAGKIREQQFSLKTRHGVFPLLKERIRRITFINNKPDEGDLMVRRAPMPERPPVASPPAVAPTPSTRTVPPTATRYLRGDDQRANDGRSE